MKDLTNFSRSKTICIEDVSKALAIYNLLKNYPVISEEAPIEYRDTSIVLPKELYKDLKVIIERFDGAPLRRDDPKMDYDPQY